MFVCAFPSYIVFVGFRVLVQLFPLFGDISVFSWPGNAEPGSTAESRPQKTCPAARLRVSYWLVASLF